MRAGEVEDDGMQRKDSDKKFSWHRILRPVPVVMESAPCDWAIAEGDEDRMTDVSLEPQTLDRHSQLRCNR